MNYWAQELRHLHFPSLLVNHQHHGVQELHVFVQTLDNIPLEKVGEMRRQNFGPGSLKREDWYVHYVPLRQ